VIAGVGGSAPGAGGHGGSGGGAGSPGGAGGSTGSAGQAGGVSGSAGGRGGTAGSGTAGAGAAGTSGGSRPYTCPAGPFTSPSGTLASPTRVTGVPIFDTFNNTGNNYMNLEGPVWLENEQALFVSEVTGSGTNPPPSRVLKVMASGAVSIAVADSGSNGMAVDGMGRLVSANHKTGSISVLSLTGGAATPLVSTYMSARFNSPNDLAIRSDGTIFFTDPDYQAPSGRPQTKTRVYMAAPGSTTAMVVDENRQQPNGIALSLDEKTLYVGTAAGLFKYPIDPATGTVGAGTQFATSISAGDGMTVDCAGNLYVAANGNSMVAVLSPAGTVIAMVSHQGVTNVAFGGADHKTLYLTTQGTGNNGPLGLFKIAMPLPGMPY
jgi:gluconolactonase